MNIIVDSRKLLWPRIIRLFSVATQTLLSCLFIEIVD